MSTVSTMKVHYQSKGDYLSLKGTNYPKGKSKGDYVSIPKVNKNTVTICQREGSKNGLAIIAIILEWPLTRRGVEGYPGRTHPKGLQ